MIIHHLVLLFLVYHHLQCSAFSYSRGHRRQRSRHQKRINQHPRKLCSHQFHHSLHTHQQLQPGLYSTSSLKSECVGATVGASLLPIDTNLNNSDNTVLSSSWIIRWRGEGTEGYSESLRQWEFTSAYRAEMRDYLLTNHSNDNNDGEDTSSSRKKKHEQQQEQDQMVNDYINNIQFEFQDALTYSGPIYNEQEDTNASNKTINGNSEINDETVEPIPLSQVAAYESAMQYVTISLPSSIELERMDLQSIIAQTTHRCSLVRTVFQIAATTTIPSSTIVISPTTDDYDSTTYISPYEQLASTAITNKSFIDMMKDGKNEDATWSIRLRRYGGPVLSMGEVGVDTNCSIDTKEKKQPQPKPKRQARYGKNVRSPLRDERMAILHMKELVMPFQGKVDLTRPDVGIYILEGLRRRLQSNSNVEEEGDKCDNNMVLARVVARGPKISIYAPKTRICITTTPLCPIASFSLCNIAQLSRLANPTILDPFAGSCATLLAATHITSSPVGEQSNVQSDNEVNKEGRKGCRSVAIEIAHNGHVSREDIVQDFKTRSLSPPVDIIKGDCLSSEIRTQARAAIGGDSFDVIITDPPYGIREAMSSGVDARNDRDSSTEPVLSPLTQLFYAMGQDRRNGTPPLLKPGGRLVAFIPVRKGETLEECIPDLKARQEAGLVQEGEGKEQVLSDILSRWLVSFINV